MRHTPRDRGRDLTIQVENIALPRVDTIPSILRESLRPPPGAPAPLVEVVYDGDLDSPSLEVHFARVVKFWVLQGTDFRSLTIRIAKDRWDASAQESRPERVARETTGRPPTPGLPRVQREPCRMRPS